MSKITLITGGTRSGKSSFAEGLLKNYDKVLYIATSIITDDEMKERVQKHKESRNSNWDTFEGYKGLGKTIKECSQSYIMIECIGTMVTNLIFDKYYDVEDLSRDQIAALEKTIVDEVKDIIKEIKNSSKEVIIITNEVGFGLISEYKLGRIFTDILGRVNQIIARESDEVYLVACGLPMRLK